MMQKEFTRQPRFLPEMPIGEKDIESPPSMPQKPEISWATTFLPPVIMLGVTIIMVIALSSTYMMISLAMTGVTLINSLLSITRQKKKYVAQKALRESKYLQYIADVKTELAIQKNIQIVALAEMNPDPAVCMNRIYNTDSKLWERTPAHDDFLSVRIGVGNVPFAVKLNCDKQRFNLDEDPLREEPQKIALEFEKVNNVSVCMDLWNGELCGIVGDNEKNIALINAIMLQVVTNHGYDDVNIVLLLKEENVPKLEWMRFLPHIWDIDYKIRFIACGHAMAHQTLSPLYDVLRARELNKEDHSSSAAIALPHYIFIVDDPLLLEKEAISKYLHNPNKSIGVSSIFTAKNKAYLPTHCRIVINTGAKAYEISNKDDNSKIVFNPDKIDESRLDFIGRKLSLLKIKISSSNFSLPKSITLNELYKIEKIEEIELHTRWMSNRTYMGMSVPIGVRAGGEPFYLDIHETGFGPHGLVAGTTGSGKSELLQSIIISIAINYHPYDVVFVLIDYKGGGMADVFQGMPHLVGTITNLGGNQTTRALISIKSELQRRQIIFSNHGVNNIDKYQKLFHNGGAAIPVPHLIMIADEFAELKAEQPDFMKELVSAARVGRSLGVHLILATQKPGGIVDDQIWSNSKFKISLKVQDVSDSRDVIKKDDAAYIKEPGRAYIQVGSDEVFEMFQSAYSGSDYDPMGEKEKSENKELNIFKVALNGRCEKVYPLNEEKISKTELSSQLSAMVRQIIKTADGMSISALPGPWPPPLTEKLFLDDILEPGKSFDYEKGIWKDQPGLRPVVGIFDNPRDQVQDKLIFDFMNDGNLFVYGMPGSGKTVFLQTLCLSLAHHYSPQEVCMYVIDFNGGLFRRMESLPHIGGVVTVDEEDKLNQFMIFIFRLIEERKKIFLNVKVDNFVQFKEKFGNELSDEKMPAMFLFLDNYTALFEIFDEVAEQMITIAREGVKYGIYMVATATNDRAYRFSINFKMAVCFEMSDKGDYDSIVGRCFGLEPSRDTGRGLVRHKPPLEFQTANCCFKEKDLETILDAFDYFVRSGKIKCAVPIPQMPDRIDIFAINTRTDPSQVAIGLIHDNLQPAMLDIQVNHLFLVTGGFGSGKSTTLVSMLNALSRSCNLRIYLKDSVSSGLYPLLSKDNVLNLDDMEDEFEFTEEIIAILDKRREELTNCRNTGGDIVALKNSWEQLVFVIDDIVEYAEDAPGAISDMLERIARKEIGMKVAVMAAGNIDDVSSGYDSLVKIFKNSQTGILFGSLKEQNVFNARIPYSSYEKSEFAAGEGYLIMKNKFVSIKAALDFSLLL